LKAQAKKMKPKAKKPVRRARKKPVARKSAQPATNGHSPIGFRTVETEWMKKHPEKLRPYAGEYVVVEGTKIVAHGIDAAAVIQTAKRRGVTIPFILFLEVPDPNVIRIGL
jgi:hypothetical protein